MKRYIITRLLVGGNHELFLFWLFAKCTWVCSSAKKGGGGGGATAIRRLVSMFMVFVGDNHDELF